MLREPFTIFRTQIRSTLRTLEFWLSVRHGVLNLSSISIYVLNLLSISTDVLDLSSVSTDVLDLSFP